MKLYEQSKAIFVCIKWNQACVAHVYLIAHLLKFMCMHFLLHVFRHSPIKLQVHLF